MARLDRQLGDGAGLIAEKEEVAGFGADGDIAEIGEVFFDFVGQFEQVGGGQVRECKDTDLAGFSFVDGDNVLFAIGGKARRKDIKTFPSFVVGVAEGRQATEPFGLSELGVAFFVEGEGDGVHSPRVFGECVGGFAIFGQAKPFDALGGFVFGADLFGGFALVGLIEEALVVVCDQPTFFGADDAAGFFGAEGVFFGDAELGVGWEGSRKAFVKLSDVCFFECIAMLAYKVIDESAFFGGYGGSCGLAERANLFLRQVRLGTQGEKLLLEALNRHVGCPCRAKWGECSVDWTTSRCFMSRIFCHAIVTWLQARCFTSGAGRRGR